MNSNLVITALGKDRPGIVTELSEAILEKGCSIAASRMSVLGGEFALILMINGSARAITAMEQARQTLEQQLDLTIISRATTAHQTLHSLVPYQIEVIAIDHPGIVHHVTQFFADKQINIEEMNTDSYSAPLTGTPMFSLTLIVGLTQETAINPLREQFFDFCDDLNLDVTFNTLQG